MSKPIASVRTEVLEKQLRRLPNCLLPQRRLSPLIAVSKYPGDTLVSWFKTRVKCAKCGGLARPSRRGSFLPVARLGCFRVLIVTRLYAYDGCGWQSEASGGEADEGHQCWHRSSAV
jgi:hypothetical protein